MSAVDLNRRRQSHERHGCLGAVCPGGDELRRADLIFSNLECLLCAPAAGHSVMGNEGFFADAAIGCEALKLAGIRAVGIANNVHYGEAAITASIARLDEVGIPHTGAGANLTAARAPAIVERNGVRFGFLQRSSVYWPTNHEAHKDAAGIAVIRGHTAYHVPMARQTGLACWFGPPPRPRRNWRMPDVPVRAAQRAQRNPALSIESGI